jgi:hypothetical protein
MMWQILHSRPHGTADAYHAVHFVDMLPYMDGCYTCTHMYSLDRTPAERALQLLAEGQSVVGASDAQSDTLRDHVVDGVLHMLTTLVVGGNKVYPITGTPM